MGIKNIIRDFVTSAVANAVIQHAVGTASQSATLLRDAGANNPTPAALGWKPHSNGCWSAPTEPARVARQCQDARERVFAVVRTARHANDDRIRLATGGGEPCEFISAGLPPDLRTLRRSECALLKRLLRAENLDYLL